jgi:hypothetical protein
MSYSEFTLQDIKTKFSTKIDEQISLFPDTAPLPVSPRLSELLQNWVPLAHAINTEKARSEFIIAPILAEVRSLFQNRISLFSGTLLNVDPQQGLTGTCDFILSLSPEQLMVDAPVIAVVEAKNENINLGIPQCMAELIACRIVNERQERAIPVVYGCVTTGTVWKYLKYGENTIIVDLDDYYISEVGRILGIFKSMIEPFALKQ